MRKYLSVLVYSALLLPIPALAQQTTTLPSNLYSTPSYIGSSGLTPGGTVTDSSTPAAANPGTAGETFQTWTTVGGGAALSGNNWGGAGGDVDIQLGKFGNLVGTPWTNGGGFDVQRLLGYVERQGRFILDSGPGANFNFGPVKLGAFYGSNMTVNMPTLLFRNKTATTLTSRQEAPLIKWVSSVYNTGAVATFSINAAGSGYAVGDFVGLNPEGCEPMWQVTTIGGGGSITGLSLYAPDGVPLAGWGCSTGNGLATLSSGAGTSATVNILTIGGPTEGEMFLRTVPCVTVSGEAAYATGNTSDSLCTQFTSDSNIRLGGQPAVPGTQWFQIGPFGGGVGIQAQQGGGVVRGNSGSLGLQANGNMNLETTAAAGQGFQFGTTNAHGAGIDTDNDSSSTAGLITTTFSYFLVNGSGGTIADGVPVKMSATANQVAPTVTTDTAAGVVIGVNVGSCAAAAVCHVAVAGFFRNVMVLGTGTCAIAQFVIVDTTTNGRIKCSTYTAGTVIGVATSAQASVGSTVNVAIGLR